MKIFMLLIMSFISLNLAAEPKPYQMPNNSYIALTGEVASTKISKGLDGFTLDYGNGLIEVEVDDFDLTDESKNIGFGEKVTVYGKIDDDLYETRSIEAGTVYAHNRNTYYFANSADEEGMYKYNYYEIPSSPLLDSWITIVGKVESTDPNDQEFIIKLGSKSFEVKTDKLPTNILDDFGFQKIEKGDVVRVSGKLDRDLFDADDIIAEVVVSIDS